MVSACHDSGAKHGDTPPTATVHLAYPVHTHIKHTFAKTFHPPTARIRDIATDVAAKLCFIQQGFIHLNNSVRENFPARIMNRPRGAVSRL